MKRFKYNEKIEIVYFNNKDINIFKIMKKYFCPFIVINNKLNKVDYINSDKEFSIYIYYNSLKLLNRNERKFIIYHEIGHIINNNFKNDFLADKYAYNKGFHLKPSDIIYKIYSDKKLINELYSERDEKILKEDL